jgi:hypothetical protein
MLEFPRLIYESLVSAARLYAQPYRFEIMKEPYKSNIYETLLEEKNQAEREEQLRKAREQHRRMLVKRALMPAPVASGAKSPPGVSRRLTVAQNTEENKIEQALLELHARQKEEEEKKKLLFLPAGQISCILQSLDPYKPASKIELFMKVGMGEKFDEHAGQMMAMEEPPTTAPSVKGVADAIYNARRRGNYVDVKGMCVCVCVLIVMQCRV